MRRLPAILVLSLAGCSTAPVADFLDRVAPGGPQSAAPPAPPPPPPLAPRRDDPPIPPVPTSMGRDNRAAKIGP